MRHTGPIRYFFKGDEALARRYMPVARKLAGYLKNQFELGRDDAGTAVRTVRFDDGTLVIAHKIADSTYNVTIDVEAVVEPSVAEGREFSGFLLPHPNSDPAGLESPFYGVFFRSDDGYFVSVATAGDAEESEINFNLEDLQFFDEVYPELYEEETELGQVDWQSSEQNIQLVAFAGDTDRIYRYYNQFRNNRIYKDGVVWAEFPQGELRGFGASLGRLWVIVEVAGEVRAYSRDYQDQPYSDNSLAEWSLHSTQPVPEDYELAGPVHFSSLGTAAAGLFIQEYEVGVLQAAEPVHLWRELTFTTEAGFRVTEARTNRATFFGNRSNLVRYTPGASVQVNRSMPFQSWAMQYSSVLRESTEEGEYREQRVLALDFEYGTNQLRRLRIDYAGSSFGLDASAQRDASGDHPGVQTYSFTSEISAVLGEGRVVLGAQELGVVDEAVATQTGGYSVSGETSGDDPRAPFGIDDPFAATGESNGTLTLTEQRSFIPKIHAADLRFGFCLFEQVMHTNAFDIVTQGSLSGGIEGPGAGDGNTLVEQYQTDILSNNSQVIVELVAVGATGVPTRTFFGQTAGLGFNEGVSSLVDTTFTGVESSPFLFLSGFTRDLAFGADGAAQPFLIPPYDDITSNLNAADTPGWFEGESGEFEFPNFRITSGHFGIRNFAYLKYATLPIPTMFSGSNPASYVNVAQTPGYSVLGDIEDSAYGDIVFEDTRYEEVFFASPFDYYGADPARIGAVA